MANVTMQPENRRRSMGIMRRWMLNSLSVMFIVLFVAVVGFAVIVSGYYFSNMQISLEQRAQTTSRFFNTNYNNSYSEYYSAAKRYAEGFEDRNKLEIQFLSSTGRVNASSSSTPAGVRPGTPDVLTAIETGQLSAWSGRDPQTGERIMAVCYPLLYANNQTVGFVRYVTGLEKIDTRVITLILIAFGAVLLIILFVITTNRFFIRSIVNPVREINIIARKIAQGSYGAKIEKEFDDEIGELCDTINDMSVEIAGAEKMKNDFISSVSHELRTPLTAIAGWGETVMYMDEPEEMKKGVDIMMKESRRLTALVEELLDFTALDGGRMKLRMESVDVAAEFEEVYYLYLETLKNQGIVFAYDCDDDLPEISGDRERLKQIFYNVIDNAAKHGGDGGRIEASICADREGGVVVTVRDFGQGIHEDDLPFIMQKFYKGASQARGSGIGLAVANELAEMHGGTLTIDSTAGEGTTVRLRLPRTIESDTKKR